ncbi:hypothetical protein GCM10012287_02830 [Streptomyces daqingensis]|uniref:HNH nuclease domain-containing protein n=1 Tax=Streptomyces daqingensis TaxID=1472640 RepID=A0ABQ2LRH9_9ACTN|nr:HNH endonuclease [Streptomyces daqingensis]GGO42295.1 hypothetical protein GCM10012287_02830 [Streptomyces daqingensis]
MTTAATPHPLANQTDRLAINAAFRAKGWEVKICNRCFVGKALDDYNKNASSADGRMSKCRACHRVSDAEWRKQNRERKAAYRAENADKLREYDAAWRDQNRARNAARPKGSDDAEPKRCTTITAGGCEQLLTRGDFHYQADRADGRNPWCKDCAIRREAERQARRRLEVVTELVEEQGGACAYCLRPFSEDLPYEIEHVHPLALDGADEFDNWVLACTECNRGQGGKFDQDPYEWLPGKLAEAGVDFHKALRGLAMCAVAD